MKVYDMSVPVLDGADWYNEEITPTVRVRNIGDLGAEGWVSHTIELAVLNGTTYIETGAHLFGDGPLLDEVLPERFLRRAHVMRCVVEEQEIRLPTEPPTGICSGEDAVLIATGWDAHFNQPDYYWKSPYFSKDLQAWLLDSRPSILGSDALSFDRPDDAAMPFLRAYFKTDGMILCPLQGLTDLPHAEMNLCAAPMKLASVNCAPCRALAWS